MVNHSLTGCKPVLLKFGMLALIIGILVVLKLAFIIATVSASMHHDSSTPVFPSDTVLAATLAQPNTDIEIMVDEQPDNPVNILAENCEKLSVSSETIQIDFPVLNDAERASIINQHDKSNRNYYAPPTHGNITVRVNTTSGTNVSICLFKKVSDYDSFMFSEEEKELQQVMHNGLCDLLLNVTQAVHNMTFTVNVPSYYFAGVRIPPNSTAVDALQISISVERHYYNRLGQEEPCFLRERKSLCKLKRRHHKTCILLYTEPSFDSNDFIEIYTSIFWDVKKNPLTWIAVVFALVVIALLTIAILVGLLRKCKKPNHHPTEADD